MKKLTLILALLCLAPVKPVRSPRGAETFKPTPVIRIPLIMPPSTKSKPAIRAVPVPSKPVTNIVLSFTVPPSENRWPGEAVFQIAWATNLATCDHTFTNGSQTMPAGWRHYAWTYSLTNTFRNTNKAAYFICRSSNVYSGAVGNWGKR